MREVNNGHLREREPAAHEAEAHRGESQEEAVEGFFANINAMGQRAASRWKRIAGASDQAASDDEPTPRPAFGVWAKSMQLELNSMSADQLRAAIELYDSLHE